MGTSSLGHGEIGPMTIEALESRRQRRQVEIDSSKDIESRRVMGQFATPHDLSYQIVSETLPFLSRKRTPLRMLETSMGIGSFVSSVFMIMPERLEGVCGYELDDDFYKEACSLWRDYPVKLEHADFTQATPDPAYDVVFSNPPYVRHHAIAAEDKLRLQKQVYDLLGIRISGLAGLYCHFMLLSSAWMKPSAVGVWLIPSEWMSVNYGSALREFLTRKVSILRIHRFESEDVRFSDALVSSCVVWFRNSPPKNKDILFTYGTDLSHPTSQQRIEIERLEKSDKWPPRESVNRDESRLGKHFIIRRGIATGDNGYFVLREEEVKRRRIPAEYLKPMLPSPRYLTTSHVTTDENGVPTNAPRQFLFDCTGIDKGRFPDSVRNYLAEGESTVGQRKLCASRNVWYEQEQRQPTRFLCSYMGRGDGRTSPVKFILNDSKAIVSNSFLMLYLKGALKDALDAHPGCEEEVWNILVNISAEDIKACGRSYGGGLYKVEPKELANIPCGALADWVCAHS